MIYLVVQPDDYYFMWQLEIQLLNFNDLGVPKCNIHILIGYHPERGLRRFFKEFIQESDYGSFFTYADTRERRSYPSSIRPHLIRKHLEFHPELRHIPIFYCDSDVIFRDLPNFYSMLNDDIWYVSDTRSYLNSGYIKKVGGEDLFFRMCSVVGIDSSLVEANDDHAGGAQYLLKDVSCEFWSKVEKDCESLYNLMNGDNCLKAEEVYLHSGQKMSDYKGIQAWCADMWAVLWNAWLWGYKVAVQNELGFCWPKDEIPEWEKKKMLHYAGVRKGDKQGNFCKGNYLHYSPFYEDFKDIKKNTCNVPLIKTIERYKVEKLSRNKEDLSDVTFLVPVRIDSEDRLENLKIVLKYLYNYFDTKILVLEADSVTRLQQVSFSPICDVHFIEDNNPLMHRTKINNILIRKSETKIVAIYDTDAILTVEQITEGVKKLRAGEADIVTPYDGECIGVDRLFKAMFDKVMDVDLLMCNKNKFSIASKRSYGGAVFINKKSYMQAGMENEYIDSWGPEDVERIKRMSILGYKTMRIKGSFFHLPHPRMNNSGYNNLANRIRLMEEYLQICNMTKKELSQYIQTWSWCQLDYQSES